ncbi:unnamed protein product [Medioppia subpectinata]|uniref:Mediator of RNA polymerase II transcription subunit 10 n=1 Tax=Medioppia subpectinata TaxID=1979941 RepID=A0A7R9L805_9ACAR|nr:unnamed protein product [Medioppia subpectinata]CAD7635709.1 unnamed protein product [Medioppia subpectinata]CAG2106172.1 unnamed protein product [Medioppia subpectinata]CAG2116139.1 unnamed protein product [Medioppia subpectinata]
MSSALDQLETNLESLTENVRQLGIIVSDFQPQGQGQTALNTKLNQIVTSLQDIDRIKNDMTGKSSDIQVPLEVFEYIDEGRNPQLYTKDCMEKALQKNELVKGKIDSYRRFKAMLLVELSKVFPNEISKYRAVRGDERPSN